MSKKAVSVTLDCDNLLWLRERTRALRRRSLSETLDDVVAEARKRGGRHARPKRSVVGTITITPSDPDLADADAAIRALFTTRARTPPRRRGARTRSTP